MSSVVETTERDGETTVICEWCGMPIEDDEQDCPALFIGGCSTV